MKFLRLSLPTAAQNLALDEALLDACDAGLAPPVLRVWEPSNRFVVLGYANSISREVNTAACAAMAIPVLRRCSGGGTVLQAPGCVNYALILPIVPRSPVSGIHEANQWIMRRQRNALQPLIPNEVQVMGDTDLACNNRKFSGNAQRRKSKALLFHGTLLNSMDLTLISLALRQPSKQPAYRSNRDHLEFVMNLGVSTDALLAALRQEWQALELMQPSDALLAASEELVRTKYAQREWNEKFP